MLTKLRGNNGEGKYKREQLKICIKTMTKRCWKEWWDMKLCGIRNETLKEKNQKI